ncbi:MAG: ABC transporter permease [Mesorhizobium sp.]|uniref:ABC transporter permease n=1 Tax=Mesorhizobium sp. TaxID=1871066 RepID=UPI000FE93079|nr:ABC transporter permease subunit [Mesorhizobium sp.]RWH82153.1 MAG: ABC transporter permease [Mesorhizobium sp.]RWH85154.1 MAG: ABC transporter permease [Mesorhizobium sp.]RWH89909.1 MAG: ABC transporter permease [Mesorhizobium sp.]RWH98341.1 MAG: ABC transporter permease [Mesorhizobium sp.]RWI04651.1 MAG: ABC transporter permease [Mesorhizobium sp.]
MTREGSPFKGTATVALKEAADHMTSARMHLIMLLVLLTAIGAVYGAIGRITETTAQDPFLFLKLLTVAREPLPSFAAFLGFLLPLVAIALGFDAVNGEYARRTMSRLLAQPIYRDAVLFGKFLGGLLVIGIALLTLWLLMTGLGILFLGLPPSGGDIVRGIAYLLTTLAYAGVWLALAIAFSTVIRSPATSALAALSVWLVLTVFWGMIAPLIAGVIVPLDPFDPLTVISQFETQQAVARVSPQTLYGEVTTMLLDPAARSVGPLFFDQVQGAIVGAPLPTIQSLLVVWPQLTALVAGMILLFTIAYVVFQRQEVRA